MFRRWWLCALIATNCTTNTKRGLLVHDLPTGASAAAPKEADGGPPRRKLAFLNGTSSSGICWIGQDKRLACRLLDEDCNLTMQLPAPTGERPVRLVHSGYDHTCALLASGAIECWGANHDLALGASAPGPVALAGRAVDVIGGFDHTCATLESGEAQCWGDNSTGQLAVRAIPDGAESRALRADPKRVIKFDTPVEQISAGGGHSCALLRGGEVRCWGDTRALKLGHELALDLALGTRIRLEKPAAAVVAGTWTTCAMLRDGTVQCWGSNEYGLLCDDGPNRHSPTTIPLPAKATAITMSETRACAVLADGGVACWGGVCQATSCDLEPTHPATEKCTPQRLPSASRVRDVVIGHRATCTLADGATPHCVCIR